MQTWKQTPKFNSVKTKLDHSLTYPQKPSQDTFYASLPFLKINLKTLQSPFFQRYPRRLQIYLALIWIAQKKEIDRKIIQKLKRAVNLKSVWRHIRHLEKQGYVIRQKCFPFIPAGKNKNGTARRAVTFNRYINPTSPANDNFLMVPIKDEYGCSIFRKGFDIWSFLIRLYNAKRPRKYHLKSLVCRSTQHYRQKKQQALIQAVQKRTRDNTLKRVLKTTEDRFLQKDFSLITLQKRKIPEKLKVAWHHTKKLSIGGKLYLAHKGVLYSKQGKLWVERAEQSTLPPGLIEGFKYGNSIQLEQFIKRGGTIEQFRKQTTH